MASCGDQGCNCLVTGGDGVSVSGAGTAKSPYIVALSGSLSDTLTVQDSETVNLSLVGAGTPSSPYQLSASATIKLTQLADVSDPQGGPNVGDVPVWIGSGAVGHFEFQPPPANPPGAVNVGSGIDGDGSIGAPLTVSVIGTTAGGATSGLEVYVDSVGNLRAVPPGALTVEWNEVSGKPSFFPANDGSFSGILSVAKGGTGSNSLDTITVGNATLNDGRRIYVQSATPAGTIPLNSLWFW